MPAAPHKPAPRKRKRTKTSPFGAPGRVNHDASSFYASRLYDGMRQEVSENLDVSRNEVSANIQILDHIFCKSCEQMSVLPDGSVHLMVTSPPSTAWGSWQSAANPTLRDVHEYILVCSKGTFSRKRPPDPALHLCR